MSDQSIRIAAQYVTSLSSFVFVRPYENKVPFNVRMQLSARVEALPTDGHTRLEFEVELSGVTADDVTLFTANCELEAIVIHEGLTPEQLHYMLHARMSGLLYGNARVAISTATMSSGYGPLTLPPMTHEQLFQQLTAAAA